MKAKSLASVLLKVLGVWIMLPEIAHTVAGIFYALWSILARPFSGPARFPLRLFLEHDLYSVVIVGLGLLLILKASCVVEKVLKIKEDE